MRALSTPVSVSGMVTFTISCRAPVIVLLDDVLRVDQRPDHFLDEERITLCLVQDQFAHALGQFLDVEQVTQQFVRMCGVERLEQDLDVVSTQQATRPFYGRPARRVFVRPEQAIDQKRQFFHQAGHAQQEIKGGGIRPVQIVEHDHRRHQVGASTEVAAHRRHDVLDERVTLQRRDRLQRRIALYGEYYLEVLRVTLGHRDASWIAMQFLAHGLGRLAFLGTDGPADHLPPGIIGDGLPVGERPPLEPGYLWP